LAKCKADFKFIHSSLKSVPGVREVRGAGLLIGIVLENEDSLLLTERLQAKGILANSANPNTIRIAPALSISKKELTKFIDIFKEVMSDVY
jgi:acetylornithine aminotransferase